MIFDKELEIFRINDLLNCLSFVDAIADKTSETLGLLTLRLMVTLKVNLRKELEIFVSNSYSKPMEAIFICLLVFITLYLTKY